MKWFKWKRSSSKEDRARSKTQAGPVWRKESKKSGRALKKPATPCITVSKKCKLSGEKPLRQKNKPEKTLKLGQNPPNRMRPLKN